MLRVLENHVDRLVLQDYLLQSSDVLVMNFAIELCG